MRIPTNTSKISTRLPTETVDAIDRVAESIGATASDVVRHCLTIGLADLEAGGIVPGFPPIRSRTANAIDAHDGLPHAREFTRTAPPRGFLLAGLDVDLR